MLTSIKPGGISWFEVIRRTWASATEDDILGRPPQLRKLFRAAKYTGNDGCQALQECAKGRLVSAPSFLTVVFSAASFIVDARGRRPSCVPPATRAAQHPTTCGAGSSSIHELP